jgi:predicted transcriptional regulator
VQPCPSANWGSKTVTFQLAKLEEAGLIDRRSHGRQIALRW